MSFTFRIRVPVDFAPFFRGLAGFALLLPCFFSALWAQTEREVEPSLSAELRVAIIEGVSQALQDVYVYEDVAGEMAALLRRNMGAGAYEGVGTRKELARRLTDDLRSLANDLHLRVEVDPTPVERTGGSQEAEGENPHGPAEVRSRTNFGLRKAEVLEGNVGYLAVDGFEGGPEAGATVVGAMNFLGNTDALILDLRQNRGGGASVIQMIFGYLLDRPTHITGFYVRETDTHQQFWSPPYMPGPSLAHVPVYVLVGPRTFSAAEAFTFSMQTLGRGTVIGEPTRGGSHPVRPVSIPETGVTVQVPFGRTVDPRTDQDWEGAGIHPDIPVPAGEALEHAHLEALGGILDGETDPVRKRSVERILERIRAEREAPILDPEAMADFVGRYSGEIEVEVVLEGGELALMIRGVRFSTLTSLGDDRFALKETSGQLVFIRDGEDRIIGFEAVVGGEGPRRFERVGSRASMGPARPLLR
jgi:hypothetical protein